MCLGRPAVVVVATFAALVAPTVALARPAAAAPSGAHLSAPRVLARAVSVATSPALVETDVPFVISGVMVPRAPGRVATLEQRRGANWLTLRSSTMTAGSRFSFRLSESKPGRWAFRVVTATPGKTGVLASHEVIEQVAVWHYLADLASLSSDLGSGQAEMNGVSYPHSLTYVSSRCLYGGVNCSGATVAATYNLERRCLTLEGIVGVDDNSPDPGVTATAEVAADGNSLFSQDVALGQPVTVDLPMTRVLRLQVDFVLGNNWGASSPNDQVDLGNTRVLCTF